MAFGELSEYQRKETTDCGWDDCKETPLLYGGVVMFPDGSTYCKGDCARRAREFRAAMVKGVRDMYARRRKRG